MRFWVGDKNVGLYGCPSFTTPLFRARVLGSLNLAMVETHQDLLYWEDA